MAIPVVDDENRLVGIVTVDDLMDVVEEEATEDIRGSVVGLFNFCGSVGTLVVVVTCGFLFYACVG